MGKVNAADIEGILATIAEIPDEGQREEMFDRILTLIGDYLEREVNEKKVTAENERKARGEFTKDEQLKQLDDRIDALTYDLDRNKFRSEVEKAKAGDELIALMLQRNEIEPPISPDAKIVAADPEKEKRIEEVSKKLDALNEDPLSSRFELEQTFKELKKLEGW